jgi:peptide/nickel transport system substrate-binding protein
MNKNVSAALSLLLALAPALPAAATVKNPDTFVYASIGDPESLDPAWAYDTSSSGIIGNVYEYLLAFDGTGIKTKDLVGRLSVKVPSKANGLISADGLTYRFPIRSGVKFHDGTPLTPDDVRYSLIRFMLFDRDGGPSSLLLEPILGVTTTRPDGKPMDDAYERAAKAVTVDKDSVVVHLPRPFAPFLSILANWGAVIPCHWAAAHGQWDGEAATWKKFNNPSHQDILPDGTADGTGPFRLARFDRATKEILLERNDAYWRKPAALKSVVIKVVDEFETRKLMLQAGDADSIYGPQMYFPQVASIPGVTAIDGLASLERSPMVFFTFKINGVGNPSIGSGKFDGDGIPSDFFSDKDVRQAFAHSIDAEAYVRDIQRGKGKANSSLLPPGMLGRQERPIKYRLDAQKAEEHFRKAWGGKLWDAGFKFTMLYNNGDAPAQAIAQMIKKNVEKVNGKFHIDIRSQQWSTFLDQSKQRKIPIFVGAWQADYPDPHNFMFPLLHSDGYFPTQQGYSNPKMDKLIEAAVRTLDEGRRAELYHKIQELYEDEMPHVEFADGYRYRSVRSWVKGYVFNPVFPDTPYGSYYYELSKSE